MNNFATLKNNNKKIRWFVKNTVIFGKILIDNRYIIGYNTIHYFNVHDK